MKRKLKKWEKALCGIMTAVLLAAGGFMGIQNFMPQERVLTIVEDASTVSEAVPVSGEEMKIKAKAAVLIDGSSGKVIFAQNERKHLPPASVTKVMTLLLIMEGCQSGRIALDDKVTISDRAAGMGGSQMYMEPGETHTVAQLMEGVAMASANDGCVAFKKETEKGERAII